MSKIQTRTVDDVAVTVAVVVAEGDTTGLSLRKSRS